MSTSQDLPTKPISTSEAVEEPSSAPPADLEVRYVSGLIAPTESNPSASASASAAAVDKAKLDDEQTMHTLDVPFPSGGIDGFGSCRIDMFSSVDASPKMRQHPWSRVYVVESRSPTGQLRRTSGYALSRTRVLTSDIHGNGSGIRVSRLYTTSPGGSAFADSDTAHSAKWFYDGQRGANLGLRYMVLMMDQGVAIVDSEGDGNYTTITAAQSINPDAELTMVTRSANTDELVQGSTGVKPLRMTNGYVAEQYFTALGGYGVSGENDYILGSPIFVTETTFEGGVGGNPITKMLLVGLATEEPKGGNESCSVNAGLFHDLGAVELILN
jgi:hypothetical protein